MSSTAPPKGADLLRASPCGPLQGAVVVPGDKSISHRALIIGGLAKGETNISGLLEGQDVLHTASAVRSFGATVERIRLGEWVVKGGEWRSPAAAVYCGNSGTGARLMMGAAAGFPIAATFEGDASLNSRPMERVLRPLREMGAKGEGSHLPATIQGGNLRGISFVNETGSAQVKSAILLAGLRASGRVEVVEPAPSRDHTENMLRAFGCEVEVSANSIRLGSMRNLSGTSVAIPGDPSSAAFPAVAALLIPGSAICLPGVMVNPLRTGLYDTLREMGAALSFENHHMVGGEPVADLTVSHSGLRGVDVPASRAPSMIDEYPILAVAAAFAHGRTVMRGIGELRVKESNRLAAIVQGLRRCGIDACEEEDALIVEGTGGAVPGGAGVQTFNDHRIAMSFLVLGLAARAPVTVDGASMIATSFPGFTGIMNLAGARIG
jgi:3-phosphoshikimate 1-carboxyvinyltransferase